MVPPHSPQAGRQGASVHPQRFPTGPTVIEASARPWRACGRPRPRSIDGEAVWCDGDGLAIFEKLHSRAYDGEVSLYAFDLLELDGTDWRQRTLEERKHRLAELLATAPPGIQYSEHLEGDGAAISKAWLKTKNRRPRACCGFGMSRARRRKELSTGG
jgi:hypothetical protein